MDATSSDKLAAAVLAIGLVHGVADRDDLIRWTDRRIESTDTPSGWLIELSLSRQWHPLDVIGLLNRVAEGIDPGAVCRAAYSLFATRPNRTFEEAAAVAERIYWMARECLDGDWAHPLYSETACIDYDFSLVRDGYSDKTRRMVVDQFETFLARHRPNDAVELLWPVKWLEPIELENGEVQWRRV